MAKSDWKWACKAGDIAPEDAANPAYRDSFVTGAFAVTEAMSRIRTKDLKEILLSVSGANGRKLLLLGWAHKLLDEAKEQGRGGCGPKRPMLRAGIFARSRDELQQRPANQETRIRPLRSHWHAAVNGANRTASGGNKMVRFTVHAVRLERSCSSRK